MESLDGSSSKGLGEPSPVKERFPSTSPEIYAETKEIVGAARKHYEDTEEGHKFDDTATLVERLKRLNSFYWKCISLRSQFADALVECDFCGLAMKWISAANSEGVFKSDSVWFPTYHLYNIIWNTSDLTHSIAAAYANTGFIPMYLRNITHKAYLENMESKNVQYVLKASISTLHNISKLTEFVHIYRKHKAVEALQPLVGSGTEFIKAVCIMTLVNIMNEDETDSLQDIEDSLAFIIGCLKKALNEKKRRYRGFQVGELLSGLAKIANTKNPSHKHRMVEEGLLPLLTKIVNDNNDATEVKQCAKIVWCLSFDKDILQKIVADRDLVTALENMNKTPQLDTKLQRAVSGALWKIRGQDEEMLTLSLKRSSDLKEKANSSGQIFISYCWRQQDIVLRMRDKLKEKGLSYWIDVEQMQGSTLVAMAKGIEDASVFIMCMSAKYKSSPNGRQEAEYAFNLRKPIIPVFVESRYKPDGWLGFILGARLYFTIYDDPKKNFDEETGKLITEIQRKLAENGTGAAVLRNGEVHRGTDAQPISSEIVAQSVNSQQLTAQPTAEPQDNSVSSTPNRNRRPTQAHDRHHHYHNNNVSVPPTCGKLSLKSDNWSRSRTTEWLRTLQLSGINTQLKELDGTLLNSLCAMRREAPDFFYKTIEKKLFLTSLNDLLRFTKGLEALCH